MIHWDAARASWDAYFDEHEATEFEDWPKGMSRQDFDGWQHSTSDNSIQARMDFELNVDEFEDEVEHRLAMALMLEQMLEDICDIAENGDTANTNDPTLKLADGRKKHGKTLKGLDIIETYGFQQAVPRKGAVEYTFYFAFNFIWE